MKKFSLLMVFALHTILMYSQSYPVITRLEGVGAGENFLEMADGEYDKILSNTTYGEVIYKPGAAPIRVEIVDSLETKEGVYIITFVDPAPGDTLSLDTKWILMNEAGDTLAVADKTIAHIMNQLIPDLGIRIFIVQSDDTGDKADTTNGAIGYSITYADSTKAKWMNFIPDDYEELPIFNFVQTDIHWYPNYLSDPWQRLSEFSPFVPFILSETSLDEPAENPRGWGITPGWVDPNAAFVQEPQFGGVLQSLNNVDIILTSDTSKWSRCVIVETSNEYYTGSGFLGIPAEGDKKSLQSRSRLSVSKHDNDGDGYPDPDGAKDANGNPLTGMGWFPGYAVDVETGERLNIFFGENSIYRTFVAEQTIAEQLGLGPEAYDMVWNPGKQIILTEIGQATPLETYCGGQHYIYVMRSKYDECAALKKDIDKTGIVKSRALAKVTWAGIPILVDDPTISLLPLNEGLIPNDVILKLRVDNPYQLKQGNGQYNDYPTYRFHLEGTTATKETASSESNFLLYPNPATNTFTIETKSDWVGESIVRIFNSNGALLLNKTFQAQEQMNVDVHSLSAGIYFVELQSARGIETKKLIIE